MKRLKDTTGAGQSKYINEPEITEPVLLCDPRGRINPSCIGWSRYPVHTCNLKGHWLRKKKWNYWLFTTEKYLFSITLTNFDYACTAFAYFYDYITGEFLEKSVFVPFGRACHMPENVRGNIIFKNKQMNVSFVEEKEYTKIYIESPVFSGTSLKAEFIVEHPDDHETLNVVIPWEKSKFSYTSKHNCLPVIGNVTLRNKMYSFDAKEALAVLDYGRGIWPVKTSWNWATSSGMQEDTAIGLNLGGKWTDGTGLTENAVYVNGKINKISDNIIFSYDSHDIMKPWKIVTQRSNRVDLLFIPFYRRNASTNLFLVKSEMHQVFGYFSGTVVTDKGEILPLKRLLGSVEEHTARW